MENSSRWNINMIYTKCFYSKSSSLWYNVQFDPLNDLMEKNKYLFLAYQMTNNFYEIYMKCI